jgi:predicted HicB family RNase H-like nuclease
MPPIHDDFAELHLRIPRLLYVELQIEAWRENVSVTEYIRTVLSERGKAARCRAP